MIDIPEGFNALMAVAYSIVPAAGQTAQAAIAAQFGSAFGELWSLHNMTCGMARQELLWEDSRYVTGAGAELLSEDLPISCVSSGCLGV